MPGARSAGRWPRRQSTRRTTLCMHGCSATSWSRCSAGIVSGRDVVHRGRSLMDTSHRVKRWIRRRGWELRQIDPGRSLDEHLHFLLPHLQINCVIDVGAHKGEYGQFLRALGYTGRIASFEPVSTNFTHLLKTVSGDSQWHAFQYALGSGDEQREIHIMQGPSFDSFLEPSSSTGDFSANVVVGSEVVNITR